MSNKLFTTVPVPKFSRSNFNLSRPVLFTPRMHKEYPTEIIEIIPGDGMKIHTEAFAKSMPMIAPTFAKMDVAQESFFVPCWQLSEHFDDFITGGERGSYKDKMPFVEVADIYFWLEHLLVPNFGINTTDPDAGTKYNERLTFFQDILELLDIMRSVPITVPSFTLMPTAAWAQDVAVANASVFRTFNSRLNSVHLRINLLPFAAVLKIWCEFYRDENLCEDLYSMYWLGEETGFDFSKAVGRVTANISNIRTANPAGFLEFMHALFGLRSRAWKKDYFTSALPFVQKGPEVQLPLGGLVPVGAYPNPLQPGPTGVQVRSGSSNPTPFYTDDGLPLNVQADLSKNILGTSIQDVRTAFKLEEMYEADGRFGSRYPENMLGQFGVRTPDSRLPRCQFLGSTKQPVTIQQVVQNSGTGDTTDTPQGNLAGLSSSYGSNRLCKTYQSQHGFLVCLTAIRVHSLYQQGIHPMFSRYDRTEYAWPRFAHLGEQPIYTKQLFVDGSVAEDETFGYTPRYADYKSDTGSIHGRLKSNLNYWTMARRFGNKPVLNEEFIYSRPRQDAFVVLNHLEPCFIMELDYHIKANRILPFYGQPHL